MTALDEEGRELPEVEEDRLPETALERAHAHAIQAEVLWETMVGEHHGRWPIPTCLDIELRLGQLWAVIAQAEVTEPSPVTLGVDTERLAQSFLRQIELLRGAIGRV